MWEYDRFEFKYQMISELINQLNNIGSEGWEVIDYIENNPLEFNKDWTSIVIVKRIKSI